MSVDLGGQQGHLRQVFRGKRGRVLPLKTLHEPEHVVDKTNPRIVLAWIQKRRLSILTKDDQ